MKMMSIVLIFLAGFLIGCEQPPSQTEQTLRGEHKLRKMAEQMDVNSRISGSFFIFVGGFSRSAETTVSVKFAWEMSDGTYAISSLPLEKIRVNLDEKATTPTIKFSWRSYETFHTGGELQRIMDCDVLYAVVTVRESDWPVQVNLPLNDSVRDIAKLPEARD